MMNWSNLKPKTKSIYLYILFRLRALVSDLEFTKKSQAYLINQLEKKL